MIDPEIMAFGLRILDWCSRMWPYALMTPEQLAEVPPGAEPTAFWGMVTECGTRRVKLPLTLGGCRIDGRLAEFTELGKLMRT